MLRSAASDWIDSSPASRTWYCYIGERATNNFYLALNHRIWGAAKLEPFAEIQNGDEIVFVNELKSIKRPVPKGFPRLDSNKFLGAIGPASLVVWGLVTSSVYEDHEPIWPDGDFPFRFRFQTNRQLQNVDLKNELSSRAVEAIRRSGIAQSRPYLVQEPQANAGDPKTVVVKDKERTHNKAQKIWMFQANPTKFDLQSHLQVDEITARPLMLEILHG